MTEITGALALDEFTSLKKSDRMPVLFVGHGSPMNAIGDNEYRRSWQALGAAFGSQYPPPQLVLCVSAHWLTDSARRGARARAMARWMPGAALGGLVGLAAGCMGFILVFRL